MYRNAPGAAASTVLCAVTIVCCLYLWRGAWDPSGPAFAGKFCVLALATLVASYHSHVHGAPLILVPVAAAWSQPTFRFRTRVTLAACLYLPTLLLSWAGAVQQRFAVSADPEMQLWSAWPDALPMLLFITAFLMVFHDVWLERPPLVRTVTRRSLGRLIRIEPTGS